MCVGAASRLRWGDDWAPWCNIVGVSSVWKGAGDGEMSTSASDWHQRAVPVGQGCTRAASCRLIWGKPSHIIAVHGSSSAGVAYILPPPGTRRQGHSKRRHDNAPVVRMSRVHGCPPLSRAQADHGSIYLCQVRRVPMYPSPPSLDRQRPTIAIGP